MLLNTITRLRAWRNRRKLRGYRLRPATEHDLEFIMAETINGTKQGHYNDPFEHPGYADDYRAGLINVIHNLPMLRLTDELVVEEIRAELLIYGCPGDDQVGYLLMSEKCQGSIDSDLEVYKIGVQKSRRRQGHGRRLVELSVAYAHSIDKIYARCLSPSVVMCRLLQEAGFVIINVKPSGTKELELNNADRC
jgi:ribosomal protein S18 acetylase RimI-like enzyme